MLKSLSPSAIAAPPCGPNLLSQTLYGAGAEKMQMFMGAGTKVSTWLRFKERFAYESDVMVELPLRPSARAVAPSGVYTVSYVLVSR